MTQKKLTIKEFCAAQNVMSINEWLFLIEINGLQKIKNTILDCAESLGLISINHSAEF